MDQNVVKEEKKPQPTKKNFCGLAQPKKNSTHFLPVCPSLKSITHQALALGSQWTWIQCMTLALQNSVHVNNASSHGTAAENPHSADP